MDVPDTPDERQDARQHPEYPVAWEADVVLRDGTTMHLRPLRPDDADAIQRFQVAQSERSAYFRFFAPVRRLTDRELNRLTHLDQRDRVLGVLPSVLPLVRSVGYVHPSRLSGACDGGSSPRLRGPVGAGD